VDGALANFDLNGKNALVTGAARGIGLEVARNAGHITLVASIYAMFNCALSAPYAISKAGAEAAAKKALAEANTEDRVSAPEHRSSVPAAAGED
jgi:short-subunit dehydrogenase